MAFVCTNDCCKMPVPVRMNGIELTSTMQVTRAVAAKMFKKKEDVGRAYLVAGEYEKRLAIFNNPFKHGIKRKKGTKRSDATLWVPFRGF